MHCIGRQAFRGGQPNGRLIEVADRAQHHHPVQIDASGVMKKTERLQNAGVLHGGGNKIALPAGLIADPVVRPLVEQFAVPEGGGGKRVAFQNEGRTVGIRSVKVRALCRQLGESSSLTAFVC